MKPFKELPLFTEEELSALEEAVQHSRHSTVTDNIVPTKNSSLFIDGGFIQLSEDQGNRLPPVNNAIKVLYNKRINDNS